MESMPSFSWSNLLAIGLGTNEMLIIAGVIVLLFGAAKIPQLMRGVGQGMGEFRKGLDEGKRPDEKP